MRALPIASSDDLEQPPALEAYWGRWKGDLSFENGTNLNVSGTLAGAGATAAGGLIGDTVVHRAPKDLPSLKVWAELWQTPGGPGWLPWIKIDFYLDSEWVGKIEGPIIGVTTFAYARGYVSFRAVS